MEASPRDIMYTLDAAHAEAEPQKLAQTDLRYSHSSQAHLFFDNFGSGLPRGLGMTIEL